MYIIFVYDYTRIASLNLLLLLFIIINIFMRIIIYSFLIYNIPKKYNMYLRLNVCNHVNLVK